MCESEVKVKVAQSCPTLCDQLQSMEFSVRGLSLLQGIFPTQGSHPGLPHCMWILYQLGQRGSPRILEWVAYLFSSRSSWSRNWTGVSCIAGGFFTNWAICMSVLRRTCMASWDKTLHRYSLPNEVLQIPGSLNPHEMGSKNKWSLNHVYILTWSIYKSLLNMGDLKSNLPPVKGFCFLVQ